jgi:hypothetical protein
MLSHGEKLLYFIKLYGVFRECEYHTGTRLTFHKMKLKFFYNHEIFLRHGLRFKVLIISGITSHSPLRMLPDTLAGECVRHSQLDFSAV